VSLTLYIKECGLGGFIRKFVVNSDLFANALRHGGGGKGGGTGGGR